MQKLLLFVGLFVFAIPASADNLLINPGFDETPWDTGWTVTTHVDEGAEGSVSPCTTVYRSAPRSCSLYAYGVGAGGSIYYNSEVSISPIISSVISCTCRVYFQRYGSGYALVWLQVNKDTLWYWINPESTWTKWEQVYSDTDTVSGITFLAAAYPPMAGCTQEVIFLIDDVHISGELVGVEEKLKVQNSKLKAYPNPFRGKTAIQFQIRDVQLKIYDLSGRVVRIFPISNNQSPIIEITWDGTDKEGKILPSGIYFAKLIGKKGEYQSLKLISIR
ncbi:T9SS type A sorting domain-containing protein [candidate division WOR-3 bacterium]|nr:T9SS type A sorting domain-containing protein [candidate division WOR-3 bacterium]